MRSRQNYLQYPIFWRMHSGRWLNIMKTKQLFFRFPICFFVAALLFQCSNVVSTKDLLDANFGQRTPIIVTPKSFSILPNEIVLIKAVGGIGPHTYKVVSGVGSIATSGQFSSSSPGRTVVQVTDSEGSSVVVAGNVLSIAKDPASISSISANLKMWLKADSLALSDGASMGVWADSSTAGNNATSGTPAPIFKKAIYNGQPVVRFSGTSNMTMGYVLTTDTTIFLVATPSSTANAYILYGNQFAGTPSIVSSWSNRAYEYIIQNGSYTDRMTLQNTASGLNVLTFSQTNALIQNFFNTLQVQSQAPVILLTGAMQLSGFSPGTAPYNGDLAEFIVFNTTLTSSDRYAIECYLIKKYGISSSASCQ